MAEKRDNSDDLELERIRQQKMQQIMKNQQLAEQKSKQKTFTTADKIDILLKVLLQPGAMQYLNEIKQRDITLYNQIRTELFPLEVIREIDLLMQYYRQGMIRQGIIDDTEIQIIERRILGIGSQITVKKQGEKATTLGSFLKEDKKK
jgi:DNA-binding TFAR19-related protein (PDSD5 family)